MKPVLHALAVLVSVCPAFQPEAHAAPVPIDHALKVTVSSAYVSPGETLTVSLTNVSPDRWLLSGGCLFAQVRQGACDGPIVKSDVCTAILKFLAPGETLSKSWDLTDQFGDPVPLGEYHMPIHVQTLDGRTAELCARTKVVLTSEPGLPFVIPPCGVTHYGQVGPGSGFVAPVIWEVGIPRVGDPAFGLHVQGGLGAAPAFLLIGAKRGQVESSIGVLAIDPAAPFVAVPLVLRGEPGLPGAGVLDLDAPIPDDPRLTGLRAHLQVIVADAHASGGYSHSGGLSITICD
ncbi:MAG: hypothetical protein ACF8XB_02265 [Planctomycetota bacterium JB042]